MTMKNDLDDTVGGKRAYHRFLWGAAIGVVILGGALAYSSQLMDVGKVFPIAGPADNAGATKAAGIK
ncbi:MAG TPA: hypothetical protein VF460_13070 [Burkholderiales bacterium]